MLQSSQMDKKIISSLILILFLTGCSLSSNQTPAPILPTHDLSSFATLTQQALEHSVQETLTAPTITSSPTITQMPLPPETLSPTQTPLFAAPTEIKFNPGGTIAYQRGSIRAGEQVTFILGAGGGQTLIASVSSEGNQVIVEVKDLEDGEMLVPFSDQNSSARIKLPWTGEYQITLTSPEDLDYFLSIEIPANLVVSPGMGASFINGTINVYQTFHPDVFTRVRYLMQLQAGSILDVQLSSQALNGLAVALIGADDGQPYLRHEVKSTAIKKFVVPESQGYYLDVYSISGESGAFSLGIDVE